MEKMNDVFGLLLFLFHLPLFIKSQSPTFWNAAAKEELKTALNIERIERRSKNVAFFLGDGMGISTLTPSRILRGEITNGEMNSLSFEKFAHVGLVKTYNTDQLVPDSAGTATAFCSGVKTKAGIIGIDDRAVRGNCSTARPEYYQKSFIKMAQEQGKSIGLVTTTRITHATPAATYAHVVDRNWEADSSMRKVPTNLRNQCPDIATQLLSNGIDYQVILGGGRKAFMMKNQSDPSNSTLKGLRDDEDLIQKWNAMQKAKNRRYRYITTGSELRTMKNSDVDYLFGIKTKGRVVGVDDRIIKNNCSSFKPEYAHKSFLRYAAEQGKSVGLVTTACLTHGTPASTYAHSPNRRWETDGDVPEKDRNKCPDIARQMLTNALDFRVILGGGRRSFMLRNQTDPRDRTKKGKRYDEDLIKLWKEKQTVRNRRFRYITGRDELLDGQETDYLLGLFASNHMEYDFNRTKDEPSLTEMVTVAQKILQRNDKGYVLFVEGGRIDHAHHKNLAKVALYETLAYDSALTNVLKNANLDDTLVMSTSDHSHVYTFGGYHKKGAPIFGPNPMDLGFGTGLAKDKKPFTSILYANGPSGPVNEIRKDINEVDTTEFKYRFQSAVPLIKETHGGEDVPVYASGPMSHLIHGVHEQHYLAHVIKYSACLGEYQNAEGCLTSFSCKLLPCFNIFVIALLAMILNSR